MLVTVRARFGHGSGTVRARFGHGSGWFGGSGTVRARFGHGSGAVRAEAAVSNQCGSCPLPIFVCEARRF